MNQSDGEHVSGSDAIVKPSARVSDQRAANASGSCRGCRSFMWRFPSSERAYSTAAMRSSSTAAFLGS